MAECREEQGAVGPELVIFFISVEKSIFKISQSEGKQNLSR